MSVMSRNYFAHCTTIATPLSASNARRCAGFAMHARLAAALGIWLAESWEKLPHGSLLGDSGEDHGTLGL